MSEKNTVHVTAENWEQEVIKSETPVLVDFWAEWCGPCRMLAPVLDEIAKETAGKIKIAKANVDENQDLAVKYRIRSIPSLLVFEKGEVKEQMVGAMRKADLSAKLAAYL